MLPDHIITVSQHRRHHTHISFIGFLADACTKEVPNVFRYGHTQVISFVDTGCQFRIFLTYVLYHSFSISASLTVDEGGLRISFVSLFHSYSG